MLRHGRGRGLEGIRQAHFNKCLARDADPPRLAIDGRQQGDGEIHIHPLHRSTGPAGGGEIEVRGEIAPRVVQGVERLTGHGGRRGIAPLPRAAPAGRR